MKRNQKAMKREIRNNRRLHRLGTRNPSCVRCGESDPAALIRQAEGILCYECQSRRRGAGAITDNHHLAGKNNDDFTIPLPRNDHRVASDLQSDWPEKTLSNPEGSPILKNAARVRGLNDLLIIISERYIGPTLDSLEEAESLLEEHLDSDLEETK